MEDVGRGGEEHPHDLSLCHCFDPSGSHMFKVTHCMCAHLCSKLEGRGEGEMKRQKDCQAKDRQGAVYSKL